MLRCSQPPERTRGRLDKGVKMASALTAPLWQKTPTRLTGKKHKAECWTPKVATRSPELVVMASLLVVMGSSPKCSCFLQAPSRGRCVLLAGTCFGVDTEAVSFSGLSYLYACARCKNLKTGHTEACHDRTFSWLSNLHFEILRRHFGDNQSLYKPMA